MKTKQKCNKNNEKSTPAPEAQMPGVRRREISGGRDFKERRTI